SAEQGCDSRNLRQQFWLRLGQRKYKEMLLDASETTLGIFGFDRTLYGKPNDKKWWMQLRRNAMYDT
ncbi:MAG: hypothetical protein WCF01_00880, partial [Nitrososphaeraceae archaeon]